MVQQVLDTGIYLLKARYMKYGAPGIVEWYLPVKGQVHEAWYTRYLPIKGQRHEAWYTRYLPVEGQVHGVWCTRSDTLVPTC